MLRRLAAVLASALVAGVLAIGASPAEAHSNTCAGTGTATVSGSGLVYVGVGPAQANLDFNFSLVGACLFSGSITASGKVSGNCGLSFGGGVTTSGDAGHAFTFTGVGSVLLVTGGVNGAVNAIPDATAGQSCANAADGANQFIVSGGALLV